MTKKVEKKIYETTNFNICVWLQMNNIALQKVIWSKEEHGLRRVRRATFFFEDFKDREVLVQDFFKQEQLQKWISISQETKARMYAVNPPVEYDRT